MRTVLIAGAGSEGPQWTEQGWSVVRLDIDPRTNPDVVGSMTDLGEIGPFDAVACNNALEHLYPHEVPRAIAEFHRVLAPGGYAVVIVPDLEGVSPTMDVIPGTPFCGLHLFYGDADKIEESPYMAHHSGFVESTLREVMEAGGFAVITKRLPMCQLMAVGTKQ